jgi:hypothetical protein
LAEYPQTVNQHGKSHYPLVRICVATHAETGLVCRPSFGPYNGPHAVGEIKLAQDLLARLPKQAIVVGDRYFGCFRFVHAAQEECLKVICRMKEINAASILGYKPTGIGEQEVQWSPSKVEKCKYPELATESVRGRFIWCPIPQRGKNEQLVLFTTTNLPAKDVVEHYARRWFVETDLRDLKSTLKMNFVDAKSPDIIAKEIVLGSCAYNLIRLMIGAAAIEARLSPRKFSFTAAIRRMHSIGIITFAGLSTNHIQRSLQIALTDLRALKLPIRAGPRPSDPRKVWPRGKISNFSNSREDERKQLQISKKNKTA